MQQRITALNHEWKEWTPQASLIQWQRDLQAHDRSAGTVKKYTQAVARFLAWYEREEQSTPPALDPDPDRLDRLPQRVAT